MNVTGITLNRLIEEFSQISDAHLQLDDFKYGNFLNIYQSNKVAYKALLMNVNNASMDENFIILQIELMVMDKVFKDLEDRDDVESDCLEILQDVFSVVSYSNRWQSFSRVSQSSQMRKFYSKGEDQVTGWAMQITLNVKRKNGICDLPVDGYDYEGEYAPFCAGVRIYEDNILIEVVASGGRYDVGSGGAFDVYYNRPWLQQNTSFRNYDEGWRIANPTDTNSGGGNSYNESIPSGSVLQEIDYSSEIVDKLKYFNIWDHKFRFTGLTGGYCDPSDELFYDKDGNLSDKATEFPFYTGTRALIVDHLTGFMMISERLGALNWNDSMDDVPTRTDAGYSDWFAPSIDEVWTLQNPELIDCLNFGGNELRRGQFNYSQPQLQTGSTRLDATTQCQRFFSNGGGGQKNFSAKTNTGANRNFWRVHLTDPVTQP